MVGRSLFSKSVRTLATLAAVLVSGSALAAAGQAFTLTTAATFPTTAAGSSSAPQTIVLTTTRAVTIASVAVAPSVNGHQEFSVGTMTGCTIGSAAAKGATCSIPVTFSPFYTGLRKQALVITDSTGLLYTVGLQGLGDGPQTLLTPTSINTTGGSSPGPYYSGDGGPVASGRFGFPEGVYMDASNNVYMADYSTNNIRVVYQAGAALACLIQIEEPTLFGLSPGSTSCAGAGSAPVAGDVYTLAGDTTVYTAIGNTHLTGKDNAVLATETTATTSTLYSPSGVTVDSNGNVIVVNYGNYVVRVIYSGGDSMACLIEVENPTLFGLSPTATSCTGANAAPQQGYIYTIAGTGTVGITGDGGKATVATMANLYGVALSKDGDIYVVDDSVTASRAVRIRVIYNGGAAAAQLIAAENPGTTPVYGNIYKVGGGVQSSSGDGGLATSGGFIYSKGIAVDNDGDVIVTDYNNGTVTSLANEGKVRVIYNGGATMANLIQLENSGVTPVIGDLYTIAGGPSTGTATGNGGLATAATFIAPYGVTVDAAGDIFVVDYNDHTVRKIQSSNGFIYQYAGTSGAASSTALGNSLTTGRFWLPFGISLGSSGTVTIGDYGIYRIRNVDISPSPITFSTVVPVGSTGTPTYVYHLNQGTKPATIASVVASTNFTTVAVDPTVSLYSKDCTTITTLAAGDGCAVAVAVQPTVGGTLTGTLTITDNSSNLASSTHTVSLTGVSGTVTQVTLTSTANPANVGTSVTYTAVVAAASGQDLTGLPALIGTVAFTDGGIAIAGSPVTIDGTGTATITEGPLTVGTHTIKAVFTPDPTVSTTYATSTNTLSQVAVAPAFTVATTSYGVAVNTGGSVSVPFTIASVGGYSGTVTGSCSGLPASVSCIFSPTSMTFTGSNNTVSDNVTIVTSTQSISALHTGRSLTEFAGILGAALIFFLPRRRRLASLLMLAFGFALTLGLSGCSSSVAPTAARGTFNVNVNFTDGTTSFTQAITVSVLGNGSK